MATDPVADVVTACRALAARGCDTGIGGHVSIRDPDRQEADVTARGPGLVRRFDLDE